ncbi:MAG: hypothetical protein JO345_11245 [Streptosporangiaceae bacterium]|nr:hypothetical protein [Streptosporangiaceae bacterium]
MLSLAREHSIKSAVINGQDILVTALLISFPVIGLDQLLRISPSALAQQPIVQIQDWVADSLLALPLFAAGIWAGDRIATRAGLGTACRVDAVKRAVVITVAAALALAPVWFWIDRSDNPVTAQPLVAPHAQDSGDVYWVPSWVILTLVCVCLAPVAAWIGWSLTRRLRPRLPRAAAAVTRMAALVPLLAAVPILAWLLHQAAGNAYASQVYYTASTRSATPVREAAPYAFADQAAHALQDGLAGQAIGLPVAAIVLLRGTRRPDSRDQHHLADA